MCRRLIYDSRNRLLTSTNGGKIITYTYDDNGNLLSEQGEDRTRTYTYDAGNRLVTATSTEGTNVTIESYAYDYEGNRISKQVNEEDKVYYLNDTAGELSQVSLELNKQPDDTYSVKKYHTRGLELLNTDIVTTSGTEKRYYVQDGHGSVTALVNEDTAVTDTYVYDAYGILLKKTGDTDNDYLYTGEQYNENTQLYYLRARYMSPETGRFSTMDSYAGALDNPVSLHKYLYANANPVMNTDPTGYFSLMDTTIAQGIQSTIDSVIVPYFNVKKIMSWANMAVTAYDVAQQIRMIYAGEASILGLTFALAKGFIVQALITCVATAALGEAAAWVLKAVNISMDSVSFVEAVKSGDPEKIIVESLRLSVSLFTLTCQCFTGETLVSTEKGETRIDEIKPGDMVWSYDTEKGERVLKKVTKVKESETDVIVHVKTSDGKDINTTMFHPFMTEKEGRREWKAASNLQKGDNLITETGESVCVEEVRVEKLAERVTVYNLEVEDLHVYYVAGVLVHNMCGSEVSGKKPSSKVLRDNMISSGQTEPSYKNAAHHIVAGSSSKAIEARQILQKYGLDINSADNGVFLPTEKGISDVAYHPSLHTNEYYRKVNALLERANSREDVIDILDMIRAGLLDGTF